MTKTPRITIVTPSYNQGNYIEETIDSVLSQNYPNLEYIIADGGSTDQSAEIIRKYEKHLAWWVSESDKGQTDAINKGLMRATGDWVAYLNSDDTYKPGAFKALTDAISSNPNAVWFSGKTEIFDDAGKVYRVRGPEITSTNRPVEWAIYECGVPQQSTFWSRSLIDQVGYFSQHFHYGFDSEYWLRLAIAGHTPVIIDALIAGFRLHSASKTVENRIPFIKEHIAFLDTYKEAFTSAEYRSAIKKLEYLEAEQNVYLAAAGEGTGLAGLISLGMSHPNLLAQRFF